MVKINGKRLCEYCFAEVGKNRSPHSCGGSSHEQHPDALPTGSVLAGRYVIGRVLGQGGFGITYLCYDVKEDKRVAVKEFFPSSMVRRGHDAHTVQVAAASQQNNFEHFRQKFFEEAKNVARFNGNPHIVSVYCFFEENNTAYFSMELLEGTNLKGYLLDSREKGVRISEGQALYVLKTVADTLLILHSVGLLHRDIAPDNIFICTDGTVKLVDFGASKLVVGQATKTLSAILKEGFAPFEQYQTNGNQGPWTDIYALGATVYLMLTDELIPDAPSRVTADAPIPQNGISDGFYRVLTKMLAVLPENRIGSIVELNQAVNMLRIVPETISAAPADVSVLPPSSPRPRLPWKIILAAAVFLAAAAAVIPNAIHYFSHTKSLPDSSSTAGVQAAVSTADLTPETGGWENAAPDQLYFPPEHYYIRRYDAIVFCVDKEIQDPAEMRFGPSKTKFDVTGIIIQNYKSVTVITASINGWCLCMDQDAFGWIRSDFLFRDMNEILPQLGNGDVMPSGLYEVDITDAKAGDLLNMRDAPRQEGALVAQIPNGARLRIADAAVIQNGRVYVACLEQGLRYAGYVLTKYLTYLSGDTGTEPAADRVAEGNADSLAEISVVSARTASGTVLEQSNVSADRSFGADRVIDGNGETCWCVNTDEKGGAGAALKLTLDQQASVTGIRLLNGNMFQMEDSVYLSNGQVKDFELTFSDGSSQRFAARKNEKSAVAYQTFYLDRPVTTSEITLTVLSGYEGTKFPTNVCIGEIEVF